MPIANPVHAPNPEIDSRVGEGAEVVHIPPGVAHVPVLVVTVTDTGLPDGRRVGHTATADHLHIDGVARTVVQDGMTVGVLVDGHTVPRGDAKKRSLALQTLSYER